MEFETGAFLVRRRCRYRRGAVGPVGDMLVAEK